jgi:hypothetical protein
MWWEAAGSAWRRGWFGLESALISWTGTLGMVSFRIVAPALLLLTLSACAGSRPVADSEYNDPRYKGGTGSLFNSEIVSVGVRKDNNANSTAQNGGGALGVNAYLWRGALDTLSFMPLASADPFGGTIITDWYQPPSSPNERFKATAYILGRQLRADGVRVSVFRQVMQNGQWVDAAVSPVTTGDIENKVLARARELRAQSQTG